MVLGTGKPKSMVPESSEGLVLKTNIWALGLSSRMDIATHVMSIRQMRSLMQGLQWCCLF